MAPKPLLPTLKTKTIQSTNTLGMSSHDCPSLLACLCLDYGCWRSVCILEYSSNILKDRWIAPRTPSVMDQMSNNQSLATAILTTILTATVKLQSPDELLLYIRKFISSIYIYILLVFCTHCVQFWINLLFIRSFGCCSVRNFFSLFLNPFSVQTECVVWNRHICSLLYIDPKGRIFRFWVECVVSSYLFRLRFGSRVPILLLR